MLSRSRFSVFLVTAIFVGTLGAAPPSPGKHPNGDGAPPPSAAPVLYPFLLFSWKTRASTTGASASCRAGRITPSSRPMTGSRSRWRRRLPERMALRLTLVDASARRLEPLQSDAARVHVLTGRDARSSASKSCRVSRDRVSRRMAWNRRGCQRRLGGREVRVSVCSRVPTPRASGCGMKVPDRSASATKESFASLSAPLS